ncbi:MAG: DUF4367 domain-containing protein [Tyzzerella sp.]|nr:DUF4367 domain-containing protein [Tyzzerella sp.]
MNEQWREIIAEEMEREAEAIMAEVNADPALKDVKAPEGMYEEFMQMIREYEKQKLYDQLSEEDREYLRIGKAYVKRRRLNRYIILVAAVVFVLAFGTVSFGENKSLFGWLSTLISEGDRTTVDSEDVEPLLYVNEHEVYEKIEEVYDFIPVRLGYLPENTEFYEAMFDENLQYINMVYEMNDETSLSYIIRPNYREASFGTVIDDERIQEYQMEVNDVDVEITEYIIMETGTKKWTVQFTYEDVVYMIRLSKVQKEEVEKVVMNLDF